MRISLAASLCTGVLTVASATWAQTPTPMPPDYRGAHVHIEGLYVTPVPNAPFTASVQIVSHQPMPDGTERVLTTTDHIARSSSGRIHNERRSLVSAGFKGEPRLIEVHLFDPNTRTSVVFDPLTHVAKQMTLPSSFSSPMQAPDLAKARKGETVTDLGSQQLAGVELHGTRKEKIVAATLSGTGKEITITDDYWYSPALSIYMIIKHDDPRTGEQLVAVTDVTRAEPAADMMSVPSSYKLVDVTPPARTSQIAVEGPATDPTSPWQ